jgi:hypothetical protein
MDQEQLQQIIFIEMDVLTAICVLGNIQLATRHPANTGPSVGYAVRWGRELQEKIVEKIPEQSAIMEMGWDPNFDMS